MVIETARRQRFTPELTIFGLAGEFWLPLASAEIFGSYEQQSGAVLQYQPSSKKLKLRLRLGFLLC